MTEDEARAAALALMPQGVELLTLSELEQYLAAAADLLRGSIDHRPLSIRAAKAVMWRYKQDGGLPPSDLEKETADLIYGRAKQRW